LVLFSHGPNEAFLVPAAMIEDTFEIFYDRTSSKGDL